MKKNNRSPKDGGVVPPSFSFAVYFCLFYKQYKGKTNTRRGTYMKATGIVRRIDELVKVLSDLKNAGIEILLVSSGAVGVGVGAT